MKIIVEQIKASIDRTDNEILEIAQARIKHIGAFSFPKRMYIYKRSIDARDNENIKFVCSVYAEVEQKKNFSKEKLEKNFIKIVNEPKIEFSSKNKSEKTPLIVGFGPAGMFCALSLAEAGLNPIVIERGADVDTRVKIVNDFYKSKNLDLNTNVQFGAGGAGTFSDGKLTTRINDPKCSYVLKTFCNFGAPKEILFTSKPHIGTDMLVNVVKNISDEIIRLGGEVRYNTKLISFDGNIAHTNNGDIEFSSIVLAIGHSARDTYEYLMKKGVMIEPKPFSVGVRVEHLQSDINQAMYGKYATDPRLGAADYNVSYRKDGRGVYSFCMCPGGEVVPGASEEGGMCVNGMSRYARDGKNANSAIAVQVNKEDYGNTAEKAIAFQRNIERRAYEIAGGNYKAPVQTLGDFYLEKAVTEPKRILPTYMNGNVSICDINKILPTFVCDYLKIGFLEFGKKIKGFNAPDVVITGVETRTSSPIRIIRNEKYCAFGTTNVYPCGEGAGYAGGIMSAAVDGINVALAILEN